MSGILRNRQDTFKPIGVKTRYVFVQLASFEKKESECESLDEVANVATLTPQERYDYEADLKMVRDTINQIRGAYEEGEEKGRAEGMEKGRVEGRAEGRAEGREEEMRRSIRTMLAFGVPAEKIAEEYGMSVADVERMAASNPE